MRRFALLTLMSVLIACGSNPTTITPPPSPYSVSVFSSAPSSNIAGDRFFDLTLRVADKNTGDSVPNQVIILQLSVGSSSPAPPNTTGTNGKVLVRWTVLKSEQIVGRTEAIAFCAPGPGQGFCRTSLSGPDAFSYQF